MEMGTVKALGPFLSLFPEASTIKGFRAFHGSLMLIGVVG